MAATINSGTAKPPRIAGRVAQTDRRRRRRRMEKDGHDRLGRNSRVSSAERNGRIARAWHRRRALVSVTRAPFMGLSSGKGTLG